MTNTITMHHATRAKMERLQALLAAEYPALTVVPVGDEIGKLAHFDVIHSEPSDDKEDGVSVVTLDVEQSKSVPDIAEIFEACDRFDLDPEAIEADEPFSGSVVNEKYKARYAAGGHPSDNGDNFAAHCRDMDLDQFLAFAAAHGVVPSAKVERVMNEQAMGWKGRARMAVGNSLRAMIKRGELTISAPIDEA
jgi:hypothetical protein